MTEKNRAGKGHPDDAALQEKRRLAGEIIERLEKEYPDAGCTLDYDDAWKLLVSVRLAAQCTDARVNVVVEKLYEKFGRENGAGILSRYFSSVTWESYPDHLVVPDAQPLISYILSCHGNQNQYILDHYKEFRSFVEKKTEHGFHITKDAGLFLCEKVTNLKKL